MRVERRVTREVRLARREVVWTDVERRDLPDMSGK
jgi:hypothetical protein